MNQNERQKITKRNENRVRDWFRRLGFESECLDSGSGKEGKKADWKFTKDGLSIVCEVKTIFSGGQFGEEKENAHSRFEDEVHHELMSDPRLKDLPFDVTIYIDRLHTVYGSKRGKFIAWLKKHIQWGACYYRNGLYQHWSAVEYDFDPSKMNSAKAGIFLSYPNTANQLSVGFMRGGTDLNFDAIERNIGDAISQLQTSSNNGDLPLIALFSGSRSLDFCDLFLFPYSENLRNKLFGSVFTKYREFLSAILLIESRPILNGPAPASIIDRIHQELNAERIDIGYLITNPYKLQDAERLREAISHQYCHFVQGATEDRSTQDNT